jgi:hypothetical protein
LLSEAGGKLQVFGHLGRFQKVVCQKEVDTNHVTTSLAKTTFDLKGNIVPIKNIKNKLQ